MMISKELLFSIRRLLRHRLNEFVHCTKGLVSWLGISKCRQVIGNFVVDVCTQEDRVISNDVLNTDGIYIHM